jgi:hypothetical protein
LAASCRGARRIELPRNVTEPLPGGGQGDSRGGDAEAGKSTIIEREHGLYL